MTDKLPSKERLEAIAYGSVRQSQEEGIFMARALLAAYEQEPIGWMHEDELPENYPYDAMFPYSKVDIVRMFPVFGPSIPTMPAGLHPDTQKLVADFSTELAEKLYNAQLKYGYSDGWKREGWAAQCLLQFQQHISKGDPRDVAAYCAFMWYHDWSTALPAPSIPAVVPTGYALVPVEPTEDMVIEGFESAPDRFFSEPEVWADYQAMSGCEQAAHRARLCWSAMLAAVPGANIPAKALQITLPDSSSKAFWSGSGKTEVFLPETYKRWVKEAIERDCCIAQIGVKVK